MRNATIITTAFTLALAAVLSGCNKSQAVPQVPAAPQVSTAEVVYKPFTEWDEFTGRLEAVKTVEVRPRVGGVIQIVAFKEGGLVKKGDLLFLIDPRPFQAEVSRLKAEQVRGEAKLALAKSDFERAKRLKGHNAIAVEEYDQRAEAVQDSQAQLEATRAQLVQANLNLEFTRVAAAIDGRVSRAVVTEGNLVTSGPTGATLLTTLVSTDKVYAYFDVDEQTYLRYARLAREGNLPNARTAQLPARLGLIGESGYPHEGHIDFLDNQMNAASGTIRVRAVFDSSKSDLTPGLFARIQLPGSGTTEGVLVNDRAIGTDLGKKFVLVVDQQNKAQYRAVETGPMVDGLRVIRGGLNAGEVIVVNGLQRVHPGMQIAPTRVSMIEPSPIERMYAQPSKPGGGTAATKSQPAAASADRGNGVRGVSAKE